MMAGSSSRTFRALTKAAGSLGLQVAASVLATVFASSLLGLAPKSPETVSPAKAAKIEARIPEAAASPVVTLLLGPVEQAALDSMARTSPVPAFSTASLTTPALAPAVGQKTRAAVLPPRRPVFVQLAETGPSPAQAPAGSSAEAKALQVAGVTIPGTAALGQYVPSLDDVAEVSAAAWTATAEAARKISDPGRLLGLLHVTTR